jgi:hypothetical protein
MEAQFLDNPFRNGLMAIWTTHPTIFDQIATEKICSPLSEIVLTHGALIKSGSLFPSLLIGPLPGEDPRDLRTTPNANADMTKSVSMFELNEQVAREAQEMSDELTYLT